MRRIFREIVSFLLDHRYSCDCFICREKRRRWSKCERTGGYEFEQKQYDEITMFECKRCGFAVEHPRD